jgi:hypothetical protein
MARSTFRQSRNVLLRAALGAALFLLAACAWRDYFRPCRKRLGAINGYEIVISSPHFAGSYPYPTPIPVTVTLINHGTTALDLDFPARNPHGMCDERIALPPPRTAVELYFAGQIIRQPNQPQTIIWRSRQPDGVPAHLTLAPGESRIVIDTAYVPPKGALSMTGGLCARVYGWELPTGIGVRRREK